MNVWCPACKGTTGHDPKCKLRECHWCKRGGIGFKSCAACRRRHDPRKLQAVRIMAVPSTATEIRGAIGLLSYHREFIPNFTEIAEPLRQMLQDTARWKRKIEWSVGELAALNEIRERLLQDARKYHYCSKECQRKHWQQEHRLKCHQICQINRNQKQ